ncbi:pseudaminic acid cytidylyltransferase [Colwellia sp. 1_MG-2023]|uniref:pseudaminic acid cytidylyltransferase n=1 Tax=Colwellia sp. 1_MG-2023 TaxID=3062649 RepID=UPI0034C6196E
MPARGGSKRIPRKNIKDFCGKPIIAYSIEAALTSQCFDQVIVSTDDAEIAQIAREYGALTPFIRPDELSDDHCGTLEVINHAINWLKTAGTPAKYVCTLYGTSPFVKASSLKQAFKVLTSQTEKIYCFGVCEYPVPIQQAFSISHSQTIEMFDPDSFGIRTQDLTPAFFDAGQFYWGTAEGFLSEKCMFSEAAIPYVLPKYEVHDIDNNDDWVLAEAMFNALKNLAD